MRRALKWIAALVSLVLLVAFLLMETTIGLELRSRSEYLGLPNRLDVQGAVVGPDGAPVNGARIIITVNDAENLPWDSSPHWLFATTDENGKFEVNEALDFRYFQFDIAAYHPGGTYGRYRVYDFELAKKPLTVVVGEYNHNGKFEELPGGPKTPAMRDPF
jgi:hypothetical protein